MKKFFANIFSFLLIGLPFLALAQAGSGGTATIENPLRYNSFIEFLTAVLNVVVEIGIPILVLMMVYIGFMFVTARGNESKISKAKEAFTYAVIGAFIVLGSFAISKLLENTVNAIKS